MIKKKGYFHQKVFFTASPIHERSLRASSIFRGKKLGVGKWLLQLMTIFFAKLLHPQSVVVVQYSSFWRHHHHNRRHQRSKNKVIESQVGKNFGRKREKTSANMEGKTRFLKCQRSWSIASGKILGGLVYNFKG